MPSARSLFVALVVGCVAFVLFAFTVVGLVGEAVVVISSAGLAVRAITATARHWRHG
jgi:hypothetical protein